MVEKQQGKMQKEQAMKSPTHTHTQDKETAE